MEKSGKVCPVISGEMLMESDHSLLNKESPYIIEVIYCKWNGTMCDIFFFLTEQTTLL